MREIRIRLPKRHASQSQVINEAKRFNVLECGRRWGKTTLGIDMVIDPALYGAPTAWFAPTYKYLSEVWREVVNILSPITKSISQQEHRVELLGGGKIDCWSLDTPDAGRGRKYKRVVLDEAGIVRDLQTVWQQAIRPTLADLQGDAWFLGTPKGRNYFHQLFVRGEEKGNTDWRSWRMPTISNPYILPSEIEAARRDMPPSAFDQEFLGIPADDGGNPFGLAAIVKCIKPLSNKPAESFGIDLAKSHDWTVVCGLDEDNNCSILERWQSDWGQTKRRILSIIGDKPALVDSTGVGDPIVEDLQREASVTGYNFSSKSKQKLMEGLAAAIQRQEVGFPDGWLRIELDTFEYEFTATGVRYSAPQGLFDDGVCGLALAVESRRIIPQFTPLGGSL
jgi:hypothetical protein